MKKNIKETFFTKLIFIIKKKIDKLYYSKYNLSVETLAREMFPWLTAIWEYKKINEYIASHSFEEVQKIIEILYSFYWGEVNLLVHTWKVDDVKNLRWLLDFALALERFRDQYLSEKESINS